MYIFAFKYFLFKYFTRIQLPVSNLYLPFIDIVFLTLTPIYFYRSLGLQTAVTGQGCKWCLSEEIRTGQTATARDV